jgi:hypothetical protein
VEQPEATLSMNTTNNKIRIAFIAHDCSLFGAQRSLLSLILNLNREIYDPVVIIPYDGPFAEVIKRSGIPIYLAQMYRWVPAAKEKGLIYTLRFILSAPSRIYRLVRLLYRLQVDVVYSNTVTNIDGAIAAKLLGKKHIWHLREGVNGNTQLSSYIPSSLIPPIVRALSHKVIVNSRWLGTHYFGENSDASIVFNGINLASFVPRYEPQPSLRQELGLSEGSLVIASIGSMDKRKGRWVQKPLKICWENS